MATVTTTFSIFKESYRVVLSSSAHYLQGTLTLGVLDNASPTTEDTTIGGDTFLSDVAGAVILQKWAVASPVLTTLLLDGDDSGASSCQPTLLTRQLRHLVRAH